ncbi:MAG: type II secretion system protein M [Rhodobacteraceae bacterium]|nr:type II secretion system protein M [Paracoccaceae bacterium]
MSVWLAAWLIARSLRERLLLAALTVALLGLVVLGGVVRPVEARRQAARAALDDVAVLEVWLAARRLELAALPPAAGEGTPAGPPAGLGGLEERLVADGLRTAVGFIANTAGGGVALRFQAVEFALLMAWLEAVEAADGYRVAGLRLRRAEEGGMVEAEIELAPSGG